ncbi:MAG: hypothetical protein PUB11_00260, partial [Oscillospiraceae bacterium]|nr:hypothetical protein [Oscillospiraceae bacterium]
MLKDSERPYSFAVLFLFCGGFLGVYTEMMSKEAATCHTRLTERRKNPLRYFEYPRDFFAVTVCHVISANK